ncbi:protocatechuate 3,4-dioxygenase subunit alpha [Nocardioides sp.]|uniref:protocatechuate 3,4-dioxygenase subunit alpha n=1 Tax=Nocardioides sp. TaxID=35761 RepID=UPI003D14294F
MIPTPGQTVGPFFGYALPFPGGDQVVPPSHPRAVRLHGRVTDGAGDPIPDALIELWQADEDGQVSQEPGALRRDGYTFTGFGRTAVDATGAYSFTTLVPGAEPGPAPFFAITVFARGLLDRLFTRAYLPGDADALAADPLLASLPGERRSTLIAGTDEHGFVFDIVLQGEDETVFLQYRTH